MSEKKIFIPLMYFLICFFWGSSWYVIKLSLEYVTPFINLGSRFLISAVAILIVMKYTNTKLDLSAESIKLYLILGFFSYSIPFSLVYWAEQTIPSSLASILFAMNPFFVAILSSIFIKEESLSLTRIVGIILSFTGIVFIFKDGLKIELSHYLPGMIAVIFSALMQASIAVTIKKKGGHLSPLSMNFIPTLIAGIFLVFIGLASENLKSNHFNIDAILMIIYLAVFVTVFNFTAYYSLLKKMSVVILSLTSFITPLIATFIGVFIGGERLSKNISTGAFFVLTGILIANWEGIKKFYHQKKVKSL
ncbi:MAG: DMT family transporter [Ignavibacteria bacterium]|nr:DMT family transporter [Ignavibacteria bacterium]